MGTPRRTACRRSEVADRVAISGSGDVVTARAVVCLPRRPRRYVPAMRARRLSGCGACLQPCETGEVVREVGQRELRAGARLADGADHQREPPLLSVGFR